MYLHKMTDVHSQAPTVWITLFPLITSVSIIVCSVEAFPSTEYTGDCCTHPHKKGPCLAEPCGEPKWGRIPVHLHNKPTAREKGYHYTKKKLRPRVPVGWLRALRLCDGWLDEAMLEGFQLTPSYICATTTSHCS
ncbi:hypothetical protein QBC35DRAFT_181719 [Podospora australis]|uniref:Uncharacterized protein n=1 Tax=Podospora australis TaxID=1536484 RepID=A0AAN6WW84_9PEZI|nr:hypothetical protein QBC35DRAFT_181719 [Podospora australis]